MQYISPCSRDFIPKTIVIVTDNKIQKIWAVQDDKSKAVFSG